MNIKLTKFFAGKKKFFPIILMILFVALLLGLLSPSKVDSIRNNWKEDLDRKVNKIQTSIEKDIQKRQEKLLETSREIKSSIRKINVEKLPSEEINSLFLKKKYFEYSLQLFDSQKTLKVWNTNSAIEPEEYKKKEFSLETTFFYHSPLIIYLSYVDTIQVANNQLFLVVSIPFEKNYNIENLYSQKLSYKTSLEEEYLTEFEIYYAPFKAKTKDGRKYSFEIENNKKEKIGLITFTKPALKSEINDYRDRISAYQSLLILLASLILAFGIGSDFVKIGSRVLKTLIVFLFLTGFRWLLFQLGFPSNFLSGPLINSAYFSSMWGNGIVKSPAEFLVSIVFFLVFAIYFFVTISRFSNEKRKESNYKKFFLLFLSSLFVSLLLLRALAAAIKSVIFDSTLRYFKDAAIIPNFITTVMNFAVLLLTLGLILMIVSMFVSAFVYYKSPDGKNRIRFILALIIATMAFSVIFVLFQNSPLYSIPLILISVALLIGLFYGILHFKTSALNSILYCTIVSSIIAITLLNFFNSSLERKSLKKTARELTRQNENLIRFMIQQTLTNAVTSHELKNSLQSNESDFNGAAFTLWSKSALQGESVNSSIIIYDKFFKPLGYFSTNIKDKISFVDLFSPSTDTIVAINEHQSPKDSAQKVISGIIPIFNNDVMLGYIAAIAQYDIHFIHDFNIPLFLASGRNTLNDVINFDNLNIFTFVEKKLVNVKGSFQPSNKHIANILTAVTSEKLDSWLNLTFQNENYITYVLLSTKGDQEKITAVALKEKELAWSFFNFFKVFIVHSIFISLFFVTTLITGLKNRSELIYSFRAQVLLSFLVISIIPLIALAIYNRENVAEKSKLLIKNSLREKALIIENYIVGKQSKGANPLNPEFLSRCASDMKETFILYKEGNLFFSAQNNLTESGLLPRMLYLPAYNELIELGYNDYCTSLSIDDFNFNILYKKINRAGVDYILAVSDVYDTNRNKFISSDFDVFLFGVYSLAIILIIALSTLLANRISSPIRKLTLATKALAHGDMNIEVQSNERGEITELIEGFNQMTRDLKKSQEDVASLERENAWKEIARQVAHEIKNPLTPMKLSVQHLISMLRDKRPNFEIGVEKILGTILNQIENLNQIASEFSRFARMPSFSLSKTDIVSIIREITLLFKEERVNIDYSTELSEAFIMGDAFQFKRMLINFIRNSLQAESSKIVISLEFENNSYTLKLKDNGKGIKPEILEKIFEKNFTTKPSGMGLGLKLSKRFVEAVGGTISVSETSTGGTTFKIVIPQYSDEENVRS